MIDHSKDGEAKLREWVENCGALISPNIFATPIPEMGGGMGVVAKRSIKNNTTLVQIPAKIMLTAKKARQSLRDAVARAIKRNRRNSECASSSNSDAGDERNAFFGEINQLSPVEAIALFLLNQRFNSEKSASAVQYGEGEEANHDDRAFWSPWISLLPPRYDNLLELEQDCGNAHDIKDVERFLRQHLPPRYTDKVLFEIESWHRTCGSLLKKPFVRELFASFSSSPALQRDEPEQSALFTPTQFIWAYNSLMSRGFSYDDETWAMMPWVDYFNYSTAPNLYMSYNASQGRYEFKTRRAVREGEQLLLAYGCYTDFELALWYGFTLCETSSSSTSSRCSRRSDAQDEKHQSYCAYCFSPLADPNGEYPASSGWVLEIVEQVRRHTVSKPSELGQEETATQMEAPVSRQESDDGARCRMLKPLRGSDCRIAAESVSSDMIQLLSAANALLVSADGEDRPNDKKGKQPKQQATTKHKIDLLRRLIRSELEQFPQQHQSATLSNGTSQSEEGDTEQRLERLSVQAPTQRWVRTVSRDSFGLLRHLSDLDDDELGDLLF